MHTQYLISHIQAQEKHLKAAIAACLNDAAVTGAESPTITLSNIPGYRQGTSSIIRMIRDRTSNLDRFHRVLVVAGRQEHLFREAESSQDPEAVCLWYAQGGREFAAEYELLHETRRRADFEFLLNIPEIVEIDGLAIASMGSPALLEYMDQHQLLGLHSQVFYPQREFWLYTCGDPDGNTRALAVSHDHSAESPLKAFRIYGHGAKTIYSSKAADMIDGFPVLEANNAVLRHQIKLLHRMLEAADDSARSAVWGAAAE